MVDRGSMTSAKWTTNMDFIDERVKTYVPAKREFLPASFEPTPWTVICGRGKTCFNHVGNRRFRVLCEANLQRYRAAQTKIEKSVIVMTIVDAVREGCGRKAGAFVKRDSMSGAWYEVGHAVAREKVGQQLRELMLATDPELQKRKSIMKKAMAKVCKRNNSAKENRDKHESRRPSCCSGSVSSIGIESIGTVVTVDEPSEFNDKRRSSIASLQSNEPRLIRAHELTTDVEMSPPNPRLASGGKGQPRGAIRSVSIYSQVSCEPNMGFSTEQDPNIVKEQNPPVTVFDCDEDVVTESDLTFAGGFGQEEAEMLRLLQQ